MRDILFRGKRADNGEWATSPYPYGTMSSDTMIHDFILDTVGQYTGMIDKNGVKIFEGDIVLKRTHNGKKPIPVTFHDGMFHCGWGGGSSTATHAYTLNDKQIEVIGNIYDNPELVGGDKNA